MSFGLARKRDQTDLRREQLSMFMPGIGDEAAIRLIYEEVCIRRESGQDVATTEVVNRYPRWKDELEVLLELLIAKMRPSSSTSLVFPTDR